MKNLIVLCQRSPLRDFLELGLGKHSDINIICAGSINEAIRLLETECYADLIFIGDKLKLDAPIIELKDSLKLYYKKTATPMAGVNKGLKAFFPDNYISSDSNPSEILSLIEEILGLDHNLTSFFDFVCLSESLCFHFEKFPCSVYVKIGNEESKFLLRFKKSDPVDKDVLLSYKDKGLTKFYIHKDDYNLLEKILLNRSMPKINKVSGLKEKHSEIYFGKLKEQIEKLDSVTELFCINSEIKEKVLKNLDKIHLKVISLGEEKRAHLDKFLKCNDDDYYLKHMAITSLLSTKLLDSLKWGNAETINNAIYSACFQNMTLMGSKELISCTSESDWYRLNENEKMKVKYHARDALTELQNSEFISSDLEHIILEQHGSKLGVGIPKAKKNSSSLSSLCMIANEFSTKILRHDDKELSSSFLTYLSQEEFKRFGLPYQEFFDLLENSIATMRYTSRPPKI